MATKEQIKDSLYTDLKDVLVAATSISSSSAGDHVDLMKHQSDASYPFFGFRGDARPISRGIGKGIFVDERKYDSSGNITAIVYRRDWLLTVDIAVLVDDKDEHTKESLFTAINDHFLQYNAIPTMDETDFHVDVLSITNEGMNGYTPESDEVVADRLQYTIKFKNTLQWDGVAAMDTINSELTTLDGTPTYQKETLD